MSQVISLRLPSELEKALKELGRATERPRTYLIRKALEAYLSDYADTQIALDRLRDKDDKILTSTEFKAALEK